ncbi:MAG: hypothetical protein ACE5RP_00035 [Nitrosopumilus sp.]
MRNLNKESIDPEDFYDTMFSEDKIDVKNERSGVGLSLKKHIPKKAI